MPEHDALKPLERLEHRILETVRELKAARQEKAQAESEAAALRETVRDLKSAGEQKAQAESEAAALRERVATLEDERRQILDRVEKLLVQIDTLAQG